MKCVIAEVIAVLLNINLSRCSIISSLITVESSFLCDLLRLSGSETF